MGRLYANENFPFPVVEELRRLGHDVLTIQETGNAGQALSDESVLAFAAMEERALLTFNRKHFIPGNQVRQSEGAVLNFTRNFLTNYEVMLSRVH